MRALEPNQSPWDIQAEMYGQRASPGGLLIAEATQISQQGQRGQKVVPIFRFCEAVGAGAIFRSLLLALRRSPRGQTALVTRD